MEDFRLDFNHDVSNKAHETFFFSKVVTAGFFAFEQVFEGRITEGAAGEGRGGWKEGKKGIVKRKTAARTPR